MKSTRILFFLLTLISLNTHSAQRYQFFITDSNVAWYVNVFHFITLSGEFPTSGTFIYDKSKPQNSKVTANIQTRNLKTHFPRVTSILKSNRFFSTAQYPTASFVSEHIEIINSSSGIIDGKITIKNITRPVHLHATLNKFNHDKKQVILSAHTTLQRSEFGITDYRTTVSNEINITINIVAYQHN